MAWWEWMIMLGLWGYSLWAQQGLYDLIARVNYKRRQEIEELQNETTSLSSDLRRAGIR
jgi:uncharacterized lipoprotein YddW (UPF0748 family)